MKSFLILLLVLIGWGCISTVQASPWPYYSFRIVGCGNSDCSIDVIYDDATTSWREIPDNLRSNKLMTQLTILGVHCGNGSSPGSFSDCSWIDRPGDHSPMPVQPSECKTTQPDNWVLANPAACASAPFHGGHNGARPGAECAILGKTDHIPSYYYYGTLDTPYGELSATQVANSRDMYCGKALQPPADCNITIPNGGVLDHGIQSPTSVSEQTLDVTIACGPSPRITIVDTMIRLDDNRIQSALTLTRQGSTSIYLLKSVLTSTNATAGSYSGSTVITVSPN